MQKQAYETPDLNVFGNIEAITAGQSQFAPNCFTGGCGDGSNVHKPPRYDGHKDKDKNKWGWPWGGWNWHW